MWHLFRWHSQARKCNYLHCRRQDQLLVRDFSFSWASLSVPSPRRWSTIVLVYWHCPVLCEKLHPRDWNVSGILPVSAFQSAADSTPNCLSCQSGPRLLASCCMLCTWNSSSGTPSPWPAWPFLKPRSRGGTGHISGQRIFCGEDRSQSVVYINFFFCFHVTLSSAILSIVIVIVKLGTRLCFFNPGLKIDLFERLLCTIKTGIFIKKTDTPDIDCRLCTTMSLVLSKTFNHWFIR